MKQTTSIETSALVADNSTQAFDMDALMKQFSMPAMPARNSIVDGEVVQRVKEGYFVSLGQKGDSLVRDVESGELEVGKTYNFYVLTDANDEGQVELSFKKAQTWTNMARRVETGEIVIAQIHNDPKRGVARSNSTERVGGMIAFIDGVRCFVPRSEIKHHGRLEDLCGKEIPVKVLSSNPNKGRTGEVILSMAQALDALQEIRLAELKAGDVIKGTPTKVIDSGVLVDLGGHLTGLVYRTEVGGDRNADPRSLITIGEEIDVKVVSLNLAKRQVSLSIRAAKQDTFLSGVKEGDAISGVVARFETYGAFVRLGDCIDGLLHIADYAVDDRKRREKLTPGQTIEVIVKSIDLERGRISLTRKGTGESKS